MKKVDFYFDFISPYVYLALTQIPRLTEQYRDVARFEGHAFNMWEARLAAGNTGPSNRQVPAKLKVLMADLNRWAKRYGVPFVQPVSMEGHQRLSRGFYVAQRYGKDIEYMTAVNNRVWGGGGDMSNPALLDDAVREIGLNPVEFSAAVDSKEMADRYDQENRDAQARGIFGAPIFAVDDQLFWGNDRISWVEEYLNKSS